MKKIKKTITLALAIAILCTASLTFASAPISTHQTEWSNFQLRVRESSPFPVRTSVKVIQDVIRCASPGIKSRVTSIDGKFGSATKDGVWDYQDLKKGGLKVDGQVGANTWRRLCQDLDNYKTETVSISQVHYFRVPTKIVSGVTLSFAGDIRRTSAQGISPYWSYATTPTGSSATFN